jgi:hypothetical protein
LPRTTVHALITGSKQANVLRERSIERGSSRNDLSTDYQDNEWTWQTLSESGGKPPHSKAALRAAENPVHEPTRIRLTTDY